MIPIRKSLVICKSAKQTFSFSNLCTIISFFFSIYIEFSLLIEMKGALNKSEHPCSSQISLHFQHPLMTKSQVLCFFIKAFILYDSSVAFICQPHGFHFLSFQPQRTSHILESG